eukprot:5681959-Prorocentrum_lima.AAC.1
MDGSDTQEQDDMLDPDILESLSQQLTDVIVPIHTPPGEHVLSASCVGHAGVCDRSRPSTPPLRTPPSPRKEP